jgi:hypothetical protein
MTARPLIVIVLLVIALALGVEWIAPQSRRAMAIAAAMIGIATWIVPAIAFAFARRPRTALARVGAAISIMSLALILSAIGLSLAITALALGEGANSARLALLFISSFWIVIATAIAFARCRSSRSGGRSS